MTERYISVSDLVRDIVDNAYMVTCELGSENGMTVVDIINTIVNQPDACVRVISEWLDICDDGSVFRCNHCGGISCCDGKYCTDCGAEMKNGH